MGGLAVECHENVLIYQRERGIHELLKTMSTHHRHRHNNNNNRRRTTYTMISTQKTLLFTTTSRHCDIYSNQERERTI